MMEDTNAKRDARRRRILENSEKRLFKITGRNPENIVSQDTSKLAHSVVDPLQNTLQNNLDRPQLNGLIGDHYNKLSDPELLNDETWNGLISTHLYMHTGAPSKETLQNVETKEFNTESLLVHSEANRSTTNDFNATSTIKTTLPWVLITSRANYVLLALVVNLLLIWKLDYLFGKMIIVPWFTVVLMHLYGYGYTYKTQEGSLLFAALILCNIKPELTYKLKTVMTVIAIIAGDLALYIFSFTLIHFTISFCLRHIDVLVVTDT